MTRKEARHWLEIELKTWEDECKSKHPIKEALSVAIKALEQEPVLDKISAEIQKLRNCSCSCSDGIIDDVEDILDKHKTER